MARTQTRVNEQKSTNDRNFLSVLFGKEFSDKELSTKDEEKILLFEKGLGNSINKSDTIDNAIEKIVKTALACEFGPSFTMQKGADKMIKTISSGILSDPQLRKQALIIMDKFATTKSSKYVHHSTETRKVH